MLRWKPGSCHVMSYHVVQVQRCLLEPSLGPSDHGDCLGENLTRSCAAPAIRPAFVPVICLCRVEAAVEGGRDAVQLSQEPACRGLQQGKLFYEGLPCF